MANKEKPIGSYLKDNSGKSLKERWKNRRQSTNVEYHSEVTVPDMIAREKKLVGIPGITPGPVRPVYPPKNQTPKKNAPTPTARPEHNSQVTPGTWTQGKNKK